MREAVPNIVLKNKKKPTPVQDPYTRHLSSKKKFIASRASSKSDLTKSVDHQATRIDLTKTQFSSGGRNQKDRGNTTTLPKTSNNSSMPANIMTDYTTNLPVSVSKATEFD